MTKEKDVSVESSVGTVQLGDLRVSRLILGGNTFSGFSHQNRDRDAEMLDYFTAENIKKLLRQAEELGITTFLGRADRHVQRVLREYWNEGGQIQWIAQTCSEYNSMARSISEAAGAGADAIYLHGGKMDNLVAQEQLDQVPAAIDQIRELGLPAGIAGHNPAVQQWANAHVDVDFYMCAYYNPSRRDENAEHVHGAVEVYDERDRTAMVETIATLDRPAIHYKVFAAGRTDPRAAFEFVAQHLRPQDAVCIGVYPKDDPDMLANDVALFQEMIG
jgi:hypothetical protein